MKRFIKKLTSVFALCISILLLAPSVQPAFAATQTSVSKSGKTWNVDLVVHYLENGVEVGTQKNVVKVKDGGIYAGWTWKETRTYNNKKYTFVSSEFTGSLKGSKGMVADKAVVMENSAAHLYYEKNPVWNVELVVHYLENGVEVGTQKNVVKVKNGGTYAGWTWKNTRTYKNKKYTFVSSEFTGSLKNSTGMVAKKSVIKQNSAAHLYYDSKPAAKPVWNVELVVHYMEDGVEVGTQKSVVKVKDGATYAGWTWKETRTYNKKTYPFAYSEFTGSLKNSKGLVANKTVIKTHSSAHMYYETAPKGLEYEIADGKAMIVGYVGEAAELAIPGGIGGYPVTEIGDTAFIGCEQLTTVKLPKTVTTIGYCAFTNCSSLEEIVIPEGVVSIGQAAFYGCKSLEELTIPKSVTEVGREAFSETPWLEREKMVIVNNTVADALNTLTEVTIPKGVTAIGDGAFNFCSELTKIVIPEGVTLIGDGAFSYCGKLSKVVLPDSLKKVESYAFGFTPWLEQVNCVVANNTLLNVTDTLTEVVVPEGVAKIAEGAFTDCWRMTSVTIPESVTSIHKDAFASLYSEAFVLKVKENSAAHTYAEKNGMRYEIY